MKKTLIALALAGVVGTTVPAFADMRGEGPRAPVRFLGPPVRIHERRHQELAPWELRQMERERLRHRRFELRRHRRFGQLERRGHERIIIRDRDWR